MSFAIYGLGTALPEHRMSQQEAITLADTVCCQSEDQTRLLKALYRLSGVEQRHSVLPHQLALDWIEGGSHAPAIAEPVLGPTTHERMEFYQQLAWPLAEAASSRALAESALAAHDITHLVTVSCTGFGAPGVDVELINRLGLRPTTQRVNVGFMGCHGAINGMRVVHAIASGDPAARVLLCAVELCSLHYRFQWDPERLVANALFADGAAALVGGAPRASVGWRVRATGSCLLPDSTDAMTWTIGDHGFEMTLSARVPDLIATHLRPWLIEWLARYEVDLAQINSWCVHPGGPRIVHAVEESLGLDRESTALSRQVLAECGNMSSPTVLFILDRMRAVDAPGPCVMLGFGPGLVAEAALLDCVLE